MNPVLNYVFQAQNVKDHKVPVLKMENEHLGGKAGEQLSRKVHMGPADARLCQRLQRESVASGVVSCPFRTTNGY